MKRLFFNKIFFDSFIEKKSLLCYTLVRRCFFSQLIFLKIIDQKRVEWGRIRKSPSLDNEKYKKLV